MTYERYLEVYKQYDEQLNHWSDIANSFPKLSNGLPTEETRGNEEFTNAKKMYNFYFQLFRKLNGDNKQYVKKYAAERRSAMMAKQVAAH